MKMKMKKTTVGIVNAFGTRRMIIKITDTMGQVTFKVKQGCLYIGKTKDGGYTTKAAAHRAALTLL